MSKILIVDDDIEFASLLAEYLEEDAFSVVLAIDGRKAIEMIDSVDVSAILLDIMMPSLNGIEVLKRIRRLSQVPIIMLTARGDDVDRISGLELGADDYVTKPCSPGEIAARLRAILRRVVYNTNDQAPIAVGELLVNSGSRTVIVRGKPLELTGLEFSILELFARSAGQLLSKDFISRKIFGAPAAPYDRRIDVHISNIRRKLGVQADGRPWIQARRGQGYQLLRAPN